LLALLSVPQKKILSKALNGDHLKLNRTLKLNHTIFSLDRLRAHLTPSLFFCMISKTLLDILCDLILYLFNTITKLLSTLRSSDRQLKQGETVQQQLVRLQAARSALQIQRADIAKRLEEIDAAINQLTQQQIIQSEKSDTSVTTLQQTIEREQAQTQRTPPRTQSRNQKSSSSIGHPYPLPYNPPHTPEGVRRNNIIAWVNDLRKQHQQ
jgi:hypothetical protein